MWKLKIIRAADTGRKNNQYLFIWNNFSKIHVYPTQNCLLEYKVIPSKQNETQKQKYHENNINNKSFLEINEYREIHQNSLK